ncbi:unnamed protein product, partial [Rotaria sp. Silwood1]
VYPNDNFDDTNAIQLAINEVINDRFVRLKLTSFSIDNNPLSFTTGYVINVNDKYVDFQVVPSHQTDIDRQVQAIFRYDSIEMRPGFSLNTYEIYQSHPN